MKAFFILIFFSLVLATCQGECIGSLFLPEIIDGKEVWPSTCADFHDGRKHLIGSTWVSHDGSSCDCRPDGLHCCRHVDVNYRPGCKTVVNPETYGYDFYLIDDTSWSC